MEIKRQEEEEKRQENNHAGTARRSAVQHVIVVARLDTSVRNVHKKAQSRLINGMFAVVSVLVRFKDFKATMTMTVRALEWLV